MGIVFVFLLLMFVNFFVVVQETRTRTMGEEVSERSRRQLCLGIH